jgi:hypothetical protein
VPAEFIGGVLFIATLENLSLYYLLLQLFIAIFGVLKEILSSEIMLGYLETLLLSPYAAIAVGIPVIRERLDINTAI